ncbi:ArdC family protein [Fusobacteria bacterium ZRK30]|nr:ArdC family protein [Fusobacteria bacterium ZRK30]
MKHTKEEKREFFKKQMDELKRNIEDKIQNFMSDSEELKKFISFRRKHFYSYSLNNTLLIYRQMPGATFVTGYKKWQELGYTVKKGAKALAIMIPMIKKVEDKVTGKIESKIFGFKKGNIFDVSQVEATEESVELPSIDVSLKVTKSTLYKPQELLYGTKAFIEQHCLIIESKDLEQALGMTDGKNIYIKPTKNRVDMAGILIHEFTHYYNHFKENRKELNKDLKESEAELCTLIFGSYFNLNIEGAYKYLSMYKDDRDLIKCFETAYKTFEYILDGSENHKGLESILEGQKN